jgi:hypothetical protein
MGGGKGQTSAGAFRDLRSPVSDPDTAVPPCVICGRGRRAERTLLHMTHRVKVWLCTTHADVSFLDAANGTTFVARLHAVWAAAGAVTPWRLAALRAHVRALRGYGTGRTRPGSYAWPELRREAEARFASGDDPVEVIRELRSRHQDDAAHAPSLRTMRRWFTDARWRSDPANPAWKPKPRWERLPWQYLLIPEGFARALCAETGQRYEPKIPGPGP